MSKTLRYRVANNEVSEGVGDSTHDAQALPSYSAQPTSTQLRLQTSPATTALPRYATLFPPPSIGTEATGSRSATERPHQVRMLPATPGSQNTVQCDRDDLPSGTPSLPSSPPSPIVSTFLQSPTSLSTSSTMQIAATTLSCQTSVPSPIVSSHSSRLSIPSILLRPAEVDVEQPREHRFHLATSNGSHWLEVKVHSEAEVSSRHPMVMERPLDGEVVLDFPREGKLKSVTVLVIGALSFKHSEQITFFKHTETLWDSTMGSPRSSTSNTVDVISTATTHSRGRFDLNQHRQPQGQRSTTFHGEYTYHFSVRIPHEATLTPNASTLRELRLPVSRDALTRLPPTFNGRPWHVSICYSLVVKVRKSGMLAPDAKLTIPIDYYPTSTPDAPSFLRRLAYEEKSALLGPDVDPEGWTTMPTTEFEGVAFRKRNVMVQCSLSFARPLAYTRGSYIPLVLTLTSSDKQTLDVLSTSDLPLVHLNRTIASGENLQNSRPFFVNHDMPRVLVVDSCPPIATAIWRKMDAHASREEDLPGRNERPGILDDELSRLYKKTLFGEIQLPNDLTPTFSFGKIGLTYTVDVLPPCAPGFVPSDELMLSRTEVTIHTCFPEGPRPRSCIGDVNSEWASSHRLAE